MQPMNRTWLLATQDRLTTVPDRLPARLVLVLRCARDAETAAAGSDRRAAWRTTRELLGGAVAAGYPARLLADCLGVGLDSIRTRAERDAWMPGSALVGIADIQASDLAFWRERGLLPDEHVRADGSRCYPAVDLVRAVAAIPDRRAPAERVATVVPAATTPTAAHAR
jgi:hypothetical protein